MKWMTYLILLLAALSSRVMAEDFGNGTGWCTSQQGTNQVPFNVTKTVTDTTGNITGSIVEASWNHGSGAFNASCDCDNTDYRGVNYFTATTGDLAEKGTYSQTTSYGAMDFYVLVANKLEIGTEMYIAGKLGAFVPVPFAALSNQDSSGGGCGSATMRSLTAGYSGRVHIYVTSPLAGQIMIPDTVIANLYLSKSSADPGNNIPGPVQPTTQVRISGTITVPQSCSINAGQIIDVKLPDILGKDIRHLGDSPQDAHVTTKVNLTCSNVANGTNLSLSLTGANDPNNNDYLQTDNQDIGIRISDKNGNTIAPNGSAELPIDNYQDGNGSSEFTAAPVNTTGNIPHTGQYQATATLSVQIR
jgi:type 1 fimbria pilin